MNFSGNISSETFSEFLKLFPDKRNLINEPVECIHVIIMIRSLGWHFLKNPYSFTTSSLISNWSGRWISCRFVIYFICLELKSHWLEDPGLSIGNVMEICNRTARDPDWIRESPLSASVSQMHVQVLQKFNRRFITRSKGSILYLDISSSKDETVSGPGSLYWNVSSEPKRVPKQIFHLIFLPFPRPIHPAQALMVQRYMVSTYNFFLIYFSGRFCIIFFQKTVPILLYYFLNSRVLPAGFIYFLHPKDSVARKGFKIQCSSHAFFVKSLARPAVLIFFCQQEWAHWMKELFYQLIHFIQWNRSQILLIRKIASKRDGQAVFICNNYQLENKRLNYHRQLLNDLRSKLAEQSV